MSITDTIAGYLIWKRGLKGFCAEKWPASYQPPAADQLPLARYALGAEEFALTIAILEQRYPCAARLEDEKVKLETAT